LTGSGSTIPIRLVRLRGTGAIVRVLSPSAVLLGALVVCACPGAARADGATDAGRAKELFERGRDLRAQGNCAEALPLFEKAYALYPPGLGSLRNVAVCDVTLGHATAARSAWLELRRAVTGSTDPKYAGWLEDADHELSQLASHIATLKIDVAVTDSAGGPSRAPREDDGISVSVDGQPLAKDRLGTVIEHDSGSAVVRASGAGVVGPDVQAVMLGGGESQHVLLHVTLRPALALPPPAPDTQSSEAPAEPQPSTPSSSTSPLRTGAWIALGVGVASLAGAAVSLVVRQTALGSLASSCSVYAAAPCPASSEGPVTSDVNRGRVASAAFSVLGVVGIASSVASITLFAISHSPSTSSALILTPTGVGAAGTF